MKNHTDEIKESIYKIIENTHGRAEIHDETDLVEDLDFTSISIIELIVDLEAAYGIQFEDERLSLASIGKFGALCAYVVKKIAEKEAAALSEEQ